MSEQEPKPAKLTEWMLSSRKALIAEIGAAAIGFTGAFIAIDKGHPLLGTGALVIGAVSNMAAVSNLEHQREQKLDDSPSELDGAGNGSW